MLAYAAGKLRLFHDYWTNLRYKFASSYKIDEKLRPEAMSFSILWLLVQHPLFVIFVVVCWCQVNCKFNSQERRQSDLEKI